MGGFFGVTSKKDCVFDLFFGTDYHSHLGTRRAGMSVLGDGKFNRAIHNISNAPFRTKFESDFHEMKGNYGIGVISDFEAQPVHVRSHHGSYSIATVGKINNLNELVDTIMEGHTHFFEMSNGEISQTELVAALINRKDNFIEGIQYAQEVIDGSMTMLILTEKGIYAVRDKMGRTPAVIGEKAEGFCVCLENTSFMNLGYKYYKELGPGEVCVITETGVRTLVDPGKDMKICTFLWVYYGYPSTTFEGMSVEEMRNRCGANIAKRDNAKPDVVAGVPDSGTAHAIGYSNEAHIPFSRPLIKYTPTWPRSFMPTIQESRDLIAKMKLIAVDDLIKNKSLLIIDDSIVRGTQLRETAEFLFDIGAKEVHVRPACPPILFGCKYLNFSRSRSELELIGRRVINKLEGRMVDGSTEEDKEILKKYTDSDSEEYAKMTEMIKEEMGFTSLMYNRLDDMIDSVGIDPCKLCTYCWNGEE